MGTLNVFSSFGVLDSTIASAIFKTSFLWAQVSPK